ncbi:MAG: cofactor-independent phosphoglycerate mutase [Candidatus Omnitrophica bacterium]|nr:cofactor-independent phosphoglycerate mutase [Candidatus Omnitrophota bacterium]
MKYIIIVPDGMADHPIESIGGKTPLEVAVTTNMDHMAQNGLIGCVQTIPDEFSPGSDIGNMSILGYDPQTYHTGRAPLEAANLNILLNDDEVIFRCNLTTIYEDHMADYSAGHISTKEANEIIQSLNKQIKYEGIEFFTGKSYRHLLKMKVKEPKAFTKIKTVPPHDILKKNIKSYLPKGADTEMLLKIMEQAKAILDEHPVNQVRADLKENPANSIWLWGQGTRPYFPPFKEKYGLSGAMISAVDLVNGIGRLADLEIIDVPGITGYYDTNFAGKAEYAIKALERHDFVYVHIEAPDEAGHNGDLNEKIKAIENIDKHIVGAILNQFDQNNARILVLPDHPTPVEIRTHTHEPVGFVMYGTGVKQDGDHVFNEVTAQEKGVLFNSGPALMEYFTK